MECHIPEQNRMTVPIQRQTGEGDLTAIAMRSTGKKGVVEVHNGEWLCLGAEAPPKGEIQASIWNFWSGRGLGGIVGNGVRFFRITSPWKLLKTGNFDAILLVFILWEWNPKRGQFLE